MRNTTKTHPKTKTKMHEKYNEKEKQAKNFEWRAVLADLETTPLLINANAGGTRWSAIHQAAMALPFRTVLVHSGAV